MTRSRHGLGSPSASPPLQLRRVGLSCWACPSEVRAQGTFIHRRRGHNGTVAGWKWACLPYHAILAGRLLRHGSKMPPTALPPSFLNRRPEPPRNGLRRHRIGHDGNRAAVARERPGCVVQHHIAAGHSGAIGRHDAHTGVQCKGLATVATGAIWGAVDHTRGRRGESDDQGRLHEPNVWVRKSHRLAFRQGHRFILQQLPDALKVPTAVYRRIVVGPSLTWPP